MSKEDILQWFAVNSASLGVTKILMLMAVGIIVGLIIYFTYKYTYAGVNYNKEFNASNVIILLITIVIMLMISSNVVISLGMVGALSIVRFRTAIKDPRDTVYIFWSIVEGLCVGSQNVKLTILSTLIIAIVIIIFSFTTKQKYDYVLVIRSYNEKINENKIEDILNKVTLKYELKSVNDIKDMTELVYEIKAKGTINLEITESIKNESGADSVNWIKENGNTLG